MLTTTLDRMAAGGMYDQLGGGFARYSTDATWLVPHFEKMLYDNAQLAQLYTRTWLVTRDDHYRRIATETLEYLLREMRHRAGGFFSSQDADSEGVEGRFFTWSWEDLVGCVGEEAAAAFGASPGGNWAGEHGEGTNVLRRPEGTQIPRKNSTRLDGSCSRNASIACDRRPTTRCSRRGTRWRSRRSRKPGGRSRTIASPSPRSTPPEFVLSNLRDTEGRLLRSWREGTPGGPAYADDHALLASAMLTLYSRTGELRWFLEARRLADDLVRLFADHDRGGFFASGADVDALVIRPKELYDNAVPSGNSAAADVLQRIALLTGDQELERIGLSAIRLIRDVLGRAPTGFGHALSALDLSLGPAREVAIIGSMDDPATRSLADEVLAARFLPNTVVAIAAPGDDVAVETVALLRDRPQVDGRATAYVCERFACLLPVTEPEDLADQLAEAAR